MIPVSEIKRFNPPVQSDVLLKYIKGVITDEKTDNINEIFNVAIDEMTSYVRHILELKSKKAGYPPDDFLRCCIRWQLLWNRIPDSDESLLEVLQDA